MVKLFAPDFSKKIAIKIIKNVTKVDFVRYLSLLSQYHINGSANRVARSYKPKMEKYYEEYIYAAINDINSTTYGKFSDVFIDKKYEDLLLTLEETIESLDIPKEYPSIIDLDVYFFGLAYQIIFKNKTIDNDKKDELKDKLNNQIKLYKNDYSHKRAPNNLGHLRNRITQSIHIYGKFIVK